MSKIMIQVEVEKETFEVGKCVAEVLVAIKAKKPIQEIIASEFAALTTAVDGIDKVPAEFAEDKAAFMKALLNPIADVAGALLAPAAAPAQPTPPPAA